MRKESMPKVLMIAPLMPPDYAGGGAQAIALAKRLLDKGIVVTGLAGTNTKQEEAVYLRKAGSIPVYRVYRDKNSGPLRNILYLLRFFLTLFRLALRHDILHFHGIRRYPLLGTVIAKILNKKTIGKISLMGTDDPITLSQGVFGLVRITFLKLLDVWIALTNEARRACLEIDIDEKRIRKIPNGVDCKRFQPIQEFAKKKVKESLGISNGFMIVYAGIICYRKGIDLLVEAIPHITSAHPGTTFVFVGPSTNDENPKVDEELTRKLRDFPNERVKVLGFVDNPLQIIRSADVFVLPSRKEGLSNVLLEAMSSGLPVVVTNHAWLDDIGQNDVHFNEFTSGDSRDLAIKISNLIEKSDVRESLAQAARSKITSSFCLEIIATKYSKLYSDLF